MSLFDSSWIPVSRVQCVVVRCTYLGRHNCYSAEIECRPQLILGEGGGLSAVEFALVASVLHGYLRCRCLIANVYTMVNN